ncbi:ABC transporter substrate-binding protein [Paracoccus sp. SCSIO 75233]|uniref:ABC transporter substrate-binding protein n=1 Tax=Paracoccus sp. SCSIO 75233 TaxID=3017782 RepID=UPI0022F1338F|nr:ABC transporter substrate-binding protein [Paracoccus sp. SCSIO 75233]WBU52670.1 ABC transporter substrate-binding protein [Paracoccus sp. SCSIO 75233]
MVRMLAALAFLFASAANAAPGRVVSVNLCTDQLAMLIATPGQLVSVSWLAADPSVSLMAEEARQVGLNHAGAEEIYLSRPDLVLAGPFAARATVDMLTRLGIRVETVPPANSVEDIRANITLMGELLGQPDRAAGLLSQFDADLAALPKGRGKVATTYGANSFANGAESLSADMMRRAGLVLLADRLGHSGGALALEQLVMAEPEMLIIGSRYETPSRAEAIVDHPAIAAMTAERFMTADRDWMCGLPAVTGTIARLAQ